MFTLNMLGVLFLDTLFAHYSYLDVSLQPFIRFFNTFRYQNSEIQT